MAKGGKVSRTGNIEQSISDVLARAYEKKCFDALLMPVELPAGDSYAYILMQDAALMERASPLPPILSAQGGKVLSSLTNHGKASQKIAAVMRPCEIRAGLELSKLGQVNLENLLLISVDCPGALPLSDYVSDSEKGKEAYRQVISDWGNDAIRPVCQTCLHFAEPVGDVHIGTIGDEKNLFFSAHSDIGREFLQSLDIAEEENLDTWGNAVRDMTEKRAGQKKTSDERLKARVLSLDGLLETFSTCIACHNCMRVCPICYCRLCYFESGDTQHEVDDYVKRAQSQGNLKVPADKLLFHSGRMAHMSLSCVGCGSCEDACPASIPVGQIFSFMADNNQELFSYRSGMNRAEKIPLVVYKEDEFEEFED